jgi:hypothetical protein
VGGEGNTRAITYANAKWECARPGAAMLALDLLLTPVWAAAPLSTNATSLAGWSGTNQSIGSWELRCDAGHGVRSRGGALKRLSLPIGARCRLRAETSYEQGHLMQGHLMQGCWEGFARRFCMPRGYVEHYRFRVTR